MLLAIYHCSVKIIGRSKGKSVIAAAAYRAGEKLCDRETGITHDFTRKGGVMHREILLPGHAPKEYADRETLRHQTEQLERYSGSDIIFQENGRLKTELEKAENRGKEMEEKAAAVLAQTGVGILCGCCRI